MSNQHEEHDHEHPQENEPGESANPLLRWFQDLINPHSHVHQQAALGPALTTDRGISNCFANSVIDPAL